MRQIDVFVDDKLLNRRQIRNNENQTPKIVVNVDGRNIIHHSTAPAKYPNEPEQLGAQVKAFVYGHHHTEPVVCTKIGPGRWVWEDESARYADQKAKRVFWNSMAVVEFLSVPNPEEPTGKPEPEGIGVVIRAQCWSSASACAANGIQSSLILKLAEDEWYCQVCMAQYDWSELSDGEFTIEREGLKP